MTVSAESEWDLIQRCRRGSRAAFKPLVQRYQPEGQAIAQAMLLDADDAADAVQDAFIRAYRGLNGLTSGSAFGPWFRTIVRNICRDRLKSPAYALRTTMVAEQVSAQTWQEPIAVERLEREELGTAVHAALARISAEHREILVLKELNGLSYAEIAHELQIPEGTVSSRLYHARMAIKHQLLAVGLAPGVK